jgi:hypothetical protein
VISIIDDDESVRAATHNLLRSLGYTGRTFVSAEEFLQSAHLNDTSCVIADVQMPGITHARTPRTVHFHHGVPRRDYPCASTEGRSNLFPDQALQQTNFDQISRYCPGEAWRQNRRMRLPLRAILHAANCGRLRCILP